MKTCFIRMEFCGQSGNGNRSSRWKGMIEKFQLSKKNLFVFFLSEEWWVLNCWGP